MLDRRSRGAVLIGGAVGTAARALVVSLVPVGEGGALAGMPWATLTANVTGALLLGFIVSRVPVRRRDAVYAGLTTGLLGAYTTFSAFALEIRQLLPTEPLTALTYAVASLALGLAAAEVGRRTGDRLRVSRTSGAPA